MLSGGGEVEGGTGGARGEGGSTLIGGSLCGSGIEGAKINTINRPHLF